MHMRFLGLVGRLVVSLVILLGLVPGPAPAFRQAEAAEGPGECPSGPSAGPGMEFRVKGPLEIFLFGGEPKYSAYIQGKVAPNTPLHLAIWHNSVRVYATDGLSGADGLYAFRNLSEDSCAGKAGSWSAYPGDVVVLRAGTETYTTTVVDVSAWMDTKTNRIQGSAPPNRTVEALVLDPGMECEIIDNTWDWYPGQSAGDGHFDIAPGNLPYNATAAVYVRDAAGAATFADVTRVGFSVDLPGNRASGSFLPKTAYTLRWERGGAPIGSRAGRADSYGQFAEYLNSPLQPGDRLVMEGGGHGMDYTVANISASFDPAAGTISGAALPGYHLEFSFGEERLSGPCELPSLCQTVTAGADGRFSLSLGYTWTTSFGYKSFVRDERGSFQGGPYLAQQPWLYFDEGRLNGADFPADITLTIRWEDGDRSLLSTLYIRTDIMGGFDAALPPIAGVRQSAQPGDRFQVSGQGAQAAAVYPKLYLRLSGQSGRLEGQASSGKLLVTLNERDAVRDISNTYCADHATNGVDPVQIAFPQGSVRGGTSADIAFIDPDHTLTRLRAYAFRVSTRLGEDQVLGHFETGPGSDTVELWRGGSRLASQTQTTAAAGPHRVLFELGTPVQPGDRLVVSGGSDGSTADFVLPVLEARSGSLPGQVVGQAPANQPFEVIVQNPKYKYGGMEARGVAGPDGTFSLDLSEAHWPEGCASFRSDDHCNQYDLFYYTPQGHSIHYVGPAPLQALADAYEPDDTPATASVYSGVQEHTQHQGDGVDWVSFTVSQEDIDSRVLFVFEMNQPGIHGEILTPAGKTIPLGGAPSDPYTLRAVHQFLQAGQYRLALYPESLASTGTCSAYYRLSIATLPTEPIFLPVIGR